MNDEQRIPQGIRRPEKQPLNQITPWMDACL
jgi:hypothetical protein